MLGFKKKRLWVKGGQGMKEKWKLIVVIIIVMIVTIAVTVSVTLNLMPATEAGEKPNPYASIMEKSLNYSSKANAYLDNITLSLQTYYSTGNTTYLIRAGENLTEAINVEKEYNKWYAFNVFKEIDDYNIDARIFDDLFTLEDTIAFYLDAVLTAQKTVS